MKILFRSVLIFLILLFSWISLSEPAQAFCGFYVAKADAKLYNQASQVILARDGKRTILTMANDYQGEIKDFALVVPVPVPIQEDQVQIGDPNIIARLDAFSAPRLVEYFDSNPCEPLQANAPFPASAPRRSSEATRGSSAIEEDLGVTIEAQFTKGEYDILILSAKESNGLETWLNRNGYKIPQGASPLLQPYIRQGMKFFVAKVNLGEFNKSESQFLRPLMIAYESPKFMLPIRLGMMNASGAQDLLIYVLSPKGQTQITNYRTVKVPSDAEIPVFVKSQFADFYKAMFNTAYLQEQKKVGFLEYAWDMSSCDPCSAEPLDQEELRKAGVFWLDEKPNSRVFISRLHVRYARNTFPEDLVFQETANTELFQGRYILRHPYTGEMNCSAGREYQRRLRSRLEQESQTLAKLTGWDIQQIRRKVNISSPSTLPWWRRLWP